MGNGAVRAIVSAAVTVIGLAFPAGARADDVPYVQSATRVVATMLSMAKVGPQDFVVDLGSGDGRIVIAAAKRYGARGLGIEMDRRLVDESRAAAAREGVADRITFLREDIFVADFSAATVVTMYLLPSVNYQLRPRLLYELRPGTRVVSHDFDMADWEPDAQTTIPVPEKPVGARKESTIYLWTIPARLAGHWRGTLAGPQGEEPVLIEFEQVFQKVRATVWLRRATMGGSGRIQGTAVALGLKQSDLQGSPVLDFRLAVTDGRLEGEAVEGDHRFVLRATRIAN
jgi:SAM-dependent methyltransferase